MRGFSEGERPPRNQKTNGRTVQRTTAEKWPSPRNLWYIRVAAICIIYVDTYIKRI